MASNPPLGTKDTLARFTAAVPSRPDAPVLRAIGSRGTSPPRRVSHLPWESIDLADMAVVGLIVAFGVLPVLFTVRAPYALHDTVSSIDAARSIIEHHFYGINGRPETNTPPGLAGLLAVMCMYGACAHSAILPAMAIIQTLGFIATYAFLRRQAPRPVAAAICLILASSPFYFVSVTMTLVAYPPYFLASSCALLLVLRFETTEGHAQRLAQGVVLALLCVASVMLASTGVALVAALIMRVLWGKQRLGLKRGWVLLAAAMLGATAQAVWMHRQAPPLEWSVPGYPHPYLQQVLVKSGNYPELGMATPRDIAARIAGNAADYAAFLTELVGRHWVESQWASPVVASVVLLILVGWVVSVRAAAAVHDWYFVGYAAINLLWPWSLEPRFFLPVAPLACLYLWRGARLALEFVRNKAQVVAASWLVVSAIPLLAAWAWVRQVSRSGSPGGVQARVSLFVWLVSAVVAAYVVWLDRGPGSSFGIPAPWIRFRRSWSQRRSAALQAPIVGAMIVAALAVVGLRQEVAIGIANRDPRSAANAPGPEVESARWLRSHTLPSAVIMARNLPTAYHYSARRIVWFPPSSDARLLMDGIRRWGVDYVIVVHRTQNYFLPSDDDSFAPLLAAYPDAFRLALQTDKFRIFRTQPAQQQ